MTWQPIDLREDPDELRYIGDPGELIDLASTLEDLAVRPAWHDDAACRGQGTEPWFPDRGDDVRPAKAVCHTCPVQQECLDAAEQERHGIWGGLSERQRRRLRRSTDVDKAA